MNMAVDPSILAKKAGDITQAIVIGRNGDAKPFNADKIRNAVKSAYLKDANGNVRPNGESQAFGEVVDIVTNLVLKALDRKLIGTNAVRIEDIQDLVELNIMRRGDHVVARDYVIYRERKLAKRNAQQPLLEATVNLIDPDGHHISWSAQDQRTWLAPYATDLKVNIALIAKQIMRELFNGAATSQIVKAAEMAVRAMTERHPHYDRMCSRIILHRLLQEASGTEFSYAADTVKKVYQDIFVSGLQRGVNVGLFDPKLLTLFDLPALANAIEPYWDLALDTLGISTLAANYLVTDKTSKPEQLLEVPQTMLMRVAMGLALNEENPTQRAIEFYGLYSTRTFLSSTPTLFNSGTTKPQLSSCYITTVPDSLEGIYGGITQNALLQKYAGGMGNDWTPVRAMGAHIKGTNGQSQGVVPFLKVVNDTAIAVNQGGKRKGAVCAYLETWHADIEEFLDLRKNTGDDRRRTHDMNTANWVPDLFMKRVIAGESWTLFSPNEVPDLHELYGKAFEVAYIGYESAAKRGEIKLSKTVDAKTLWRKMLTMIFETGHPWITFKDPCNVRSPQKHAGVVHSSNLCTEITLNTSADEIAVCNLGSVNIRAHIEQDIFGNWAIDDVKLGRTVTTAMRMLDNVIDVNLYAREEARNSNMRHRPVAMGMMGLQDALHAMHLAFESPKAVAFSSDFTEAMCYHAYRASAMLAKERGSYESFHGSDWSKGILPCDTVAALEAERGIPIEKPQGYGVVPQRWSDLRQLVTSGMRNSNCVAIAPTATIANIMGVDQSIEPSFGNLSVKSNLAGEFTVLNGYLVDELEELGLWDDLMVAELKGFDGSVQKIDRIPGELKSRYKTAFEIDSLAPVWHTAARGQWIDQAQSTNLYMGQASGKAIDALYKAAWVMGLKTTYYMRINGATAAEKSTIQTTTLNAVQQGGQGHTMPEPTGAACMLRPGDTGFETCESCQ
jgi:ribonucleoside-diphosphate reductase alpha chain